MMAKLADDQYGSDLTEDYLTDVSQTEIKDLEKLIIDWADKYKIAPQFYDVENIKEIHVEGI